MSAPERIAERLSRAITTAANDDRTTVGTEDRRRFCQRMSAMSYARDLIEEMASLAPDLHAVIMHLRAAEHHHEAAAENIRIARETAERAAVALREGEGR